MGGNREAVLTFSPTLPLGGYVGYWHMENDATPSGLRRLNLDTPGSRGGNPGLEVLTASRYLVSAYRTSMPQILMCKFSPLSERRLQTLRKQESRAERRKQ